MGSIVNISNFGDIRDWRKQKIEEYKKILILHIALDLQGPQYGNGGFKL